LGVSGTVEAKASLGRQVLEPEEWPSSSLMGDIDARGWLSAACCYAEQMNL